MLQILCKIFEIINAKLIVCRILNHYRSQVDEHTSARGGYFLLCQVLILDRVYAYMPIWVLLFQKPRPSSYPKFSKS